MPFTFLGDSPLLYTQYRDLGTDRPLLAVPGESYDMAPVGHWDLTVPPSDGRWDPPAADPDPPGDDGEDGQGEPDGGEGGADLPPVPLMTGSSTEGEDN